VAVIGELTTSLSPSSGVLACTRSAHPISGLGVYPRVCFIEGVSVFTFRFARVQRRNPIAPHHVVGPCRWRKMRRIHTSSMRAHRATIATFGVMACVVERLRFRWSVRQLVGEPVRQDRTVSRDPEVPVPSRYGARPNPTVSGLIDSPPEPFLNGKRGPVIRRSVPTPAHVVGLAPTSCNDQAIASVHGAHDAIVVGGC